MPVSYTHLSLDCDDGIEYSACLHEPTPQELLERMELFIRLWNALNSLPEDVYKRQDMRQTVAVKANIDHLLGVTDGRENKAQER